MSIFWAIFLSSYWTLSPSIYLPNKILRLFLSLFIFQTNSTFLRLFLSLFLTNFNYIIDSTLRYIVFLLDLFFEPISYVDTLYLFRYSGPCSDLYLPFSFLRYLHRYRYLLSSVSYSFSSLDSHHIPFLSLFGRALIGSCTYFDPRHDLKSWNKNWLSKDG